MPKAKSGEAISPSRKTPEEIAKLTAVLREAKTKNDLSTWRRAIAVQNYIDGKKAAAIAKEFNVSRAAVNYWIQWYEAQGADGLITRKSPGAPRRLSEEDLATLVTLIEAGPQACGYAGGVWTGPRIGHLIETHFGVHYHCQHIPRLLHRLGFSVQRPRKRLARAEAEAQEIWLSSRFPAIKKKLCAAEG